MRFPYGEWRVCYSVYSGGKRCYQMVTSSCRRLLTYYDYSIPCKGISNSLILILQEENLFNGFPEHLRHLQGQDRGGHISP